MNPKPQQRSQVRLQAGRLFYFLKKQFYWAWHSRRLSIKTQSTLLPHLIFEHQTLLRRPLRDLDMQLQENKIVNLELAIRRLDNLVIEPGKTFSYWRQIGWPLRRKGYIDGMILQEGKVSRGVGGGLCQLSNLIYWMTLHTPLTVTERWRHSYDVFPDTNRTLPFGSGATCAYPNIDLQIWNSTVQRFQLHLYLTDTHLVGEWRTDEKLLVSYHVYEKEPRMQHEFWGGYTRHNIIMRDTIDLETKEVIKTENITENHAIMMYTPFLEGSK
ncbi:MAG: VanW family protein [Patescibacteria group bacterium]|nr:VanW family protein [Patescibacteria group bacterium]